ncbi:MAG: chromate efflux transporter [Rhodobacteraceae bacterium]|nr:chromate efflux transporter [Paracoccaceae bacterium]
MSFGGPAAQIAVMHHELVETRDWLTEAQFLAGLSFCMLLPGPEAMQLATYAGWRLHGVRGGLVAGLLFVLPGAVVMLALAAGYSAFGAVPTVQAAFLGIKAAIVVIVIDALRRVARRALTGRAQRIIAALAFVALFAFAMPFPAVVILAGLYGAATAPTSATRPPPVPLRPALRMAAIWAAVWLIPLGLLAVLEHGLLTQIGAYFARLAVLSFGGAYALLAWMAQTVVADFHWLTPAQMVDGLGLAETTPGPLILVTEFVGYLAAARHGGAWGGVLGALVTLWMTFAPCFLWVFVGAPWIEAITTRPRLTAALNAVMAAVVGVILNLSLWFALHVAFHAVGLFAWGPLHVPLPQLSSVDWRALALTALAAVIVLRLRWPLPVALAVAAAMGLIGGL